MCQRIAKKTRFLSNECEKDTTSVTIAGKARFLSTVEREEVAIAKKLRFLPKGRKNMLLFYKNRKTEFLPKDRETGAISVKGRDTDAISVKGSPNRPKLCRKIVNQTQFLSKDRETNSTCIKKTRNRLDFYQMIAKEYHFFQRFAKHTRCLSRNRENDAISVKGSQNRRDFWQIIAKQKRIMRMRICSFGRGWVGFMIFLVLGKVQICTSSTLLKFL